MELHKDYFELVENRQNSPINWEVFGRNLVMMDFVAIKRTLAQITKLVNSKRLSMIDEVIPVYINIMEALPRSLENEDRELFNLLSENMAKIAAGFDSQPVLYRLFLFGTLDIKVKRLFCNALIIYGINYSPRPTEFLYTLAYHLVHVYVETEDSFYVDLLMIMKQHAGYILLKAVKEITGNYSRDSYKRAIMVDLYGNLTDGEI